MAESLREAIATLLQVFKVEEALSGEGPYARLNLSDLNVLLFLGASGEPQAMSAIAAALSAKLSTAGTIADRLVRAGLVERRRVEDDRRLVLLALTPAGAELHEETVAVQRRHCAAMLDVLSSDEEREQLLELLGKIAGAAAALRARRLPRA